VIDARTESVEVRPEHRVLRASHTKARATEPQAFEMALPVADDPGADREGLEHTVPVVQSTVGDGHGPLRPSVDEDEVRLR